MKEDRLFYTLALTQGFSAIGSRMSGIAIGFAVYAATGKAAPILLFSLFSEFPAMIGASLAGAWVDRGDAKKAVILADLGQAIGSLALVASFLTGSFELWQLYAVGLWQGFCAMFQEPAKSSLTARLVPDQGRDRANALLSAAHPAAGVIAPGLAGLLYGSIGIAGVLAIDVATFLAAVAVVSRARMPPPGKETGRPGPGSLFGDLGSLLRFLKARPALALLVLYSGLLNFLLNGPLGLALPYSLAVTGSATSSGLALSLEGLGGLLGSLLLIARGRSRSRSRSLLLGMSGAGFFMLALSVARTPLFLGAALFCVIACLQTWSRFSSIFQAEAPPEFQASLAGLSAQLGYLGSTLSFALVGPLVDRLLEPAAGKAPWWSLLSPLLGSSPGAGMGLAIGAAGLLILAASAAIACLPAVRLVGHPTR